MGYDVLVLRGCQPSWDVRVHLLIPIILLFSLVWTSLFSSLYNSLVHCALIIINKEVCLRFQKNSSCKVKELFKVPLCRMDWSWDFDINIFGTKKLFVRVLKDFLFVASQFLVFFSISYDYKCLMETFHSFIIQLQPLQVLQTRIQQKFMGL